MELQGLGSRRFEAGGTSLTLHQDVAASRALTPLLLLDSEGGGQGGSRGRAGAETERAPGDGSCLDSVGFVAWQCGLLLADYLLRRPPFRQWQDVRVVDLGAGTGVVGIALALAGADVVLADLPHVTPLTRLNVQANCDPSRHRAEVAEYEWGAEGELPTALLQPPPDILAGADLVYDPAAYPALLAALSALAAPHTLVYLAIKLRGKGEAGFLESLGAAGFAVAQVPAAQLGEEYQEEGGTYQVVRAVKLG